MDDTVSNLNLDDIHVYLRSVIDSLYYQDKLIQDDPIVSNIVDDCRELIEMAE